jgi:hypothetical protein
MYALIWEAEARSILHIQTLVPSLFQASNSTNTTTEESNRSKLTANRTDFAPMKMTIWVVENSSFSWNFFYKMPPE